MRIIIQKLLRDLWREKNKLALSLSAAILAIWGLSSVFYGYLLTERDFEENFMASHPANLILTIEGASEQMTNVLLSHEEVSEIERREMLSGRIVEEDGSWMPFLIVGVEDFASVRLNRFTMLDSLSEQADGFYIEQNAAWFLEENVQNIEWQIPGVQNLRNPVVGHVHDARLPPARMEHMVYGFTSIANIRPYLDSTIQRLLIGTRDRGLSHEALQELGLELTETLTGMGGEVLSMSIPPPGEHPHQNIVDGVALLQQALGGILAVLGLVLLILILLSWLYPQLNEIGIMKAIGASSRQIFWSYVGVLTSLIGVALLIGLPAGFFTAKGFSGFIAFIQNFEPVSRPLPIQHHGWIGLCAAVAPLLLCLPPILNAVKTTVRAAINQVFTVPASRWILLTNVWPSSSRSKYLLSHLIRRPQTTVLLMGMIAVGFGIYVLGSNLRYSIKQDLAFYFEELDHDMLISMDEDQQKDVSDLRTLPEVASVSTLYREKVSFHIPGQERKESRRLKIFPPGYQLSESLFVQGKARKDCDSCIYINQGLKDEFMHLSLGDPIKLQHANGQTYAYTYSGIIKEMGVLPGLYRFSTQPVPVYDQLAISLVPGAQLAEASEKIEAFLEKRGMLVADIFDVERRLAMLEDHLKVSFITIQILGGITLILGVLGILIYLSLAIEERSREIGILKSIGSSSRQIARLFLDEFLILNGLGLLLGFAMSWISTVYLCQLFGEMVLKLGFPPRLDVLQLLLSVLVLILVQLGLILWRSEDKIRKSARGLMDQ